MQPMSASWLIVVASLLFATMGVCVKLASQHYGSGEIVMYRGLVGVVMIGAMSRWRGETLRTRVPAQHLLRSLTGVVALCLWFYAIGRLPLATAMTLNYTSSLWLALFLLGSATVLGDKPVDLRLVFTALVGFAAVVMVLRPTIEKDQLWHGLVGLLSGLVSAAGYLQVAALGRAGEPESRIVFYFSVGGVLGGAALGTLTGWHAHSWAGLGLLLGVGVLATAAQLMLTRAYVRGRTLVNASLQYLGIGFSYLYGVLLFDDDVTLIAVTGTLLIVGAGVRATMLRTPAGPAFERPPAKP
jgi:drug/metabolite transporter (DMT)-like permease